MGECEKGGFYSLHVVLFNIGETVEWEWQELLCCTVQIVGQEHEVGIPRSSYRWEFRVFPTGRQMLLSEVETFRRKMY